MRQIEGRHNNRKQLRNEYAEVLTQYLLEPGPPRLREAERVSRRAAGEGPSLREMAEIYHEALGAAVARMMARGAEARPPARSAIRAAGVVFTSSLLPFEKRQLESEQAAAALRQQNWKLEEQAGRISHAIYDDTLQLVAATHLLVHEIGQTNSLDAGQFTRLVTALGQIESRLNGLAYELRPCVLDHLGLEAAVDWLAKYFSDQTGLEIETDTAIAMPLSSRLATALYRAIQEALRNVASHAKATSVVIRLRREAGAVTCSVTDNGVGFDAAPVFEGRGERGLGLIGIRENMRMFGGTMTVQSAIGAGTGILISAPLGQDAPAPRKRSRPVRKAGGARRSGGPR